MTLTVVDSVWNELHDRLGSDLRAVTGYDGIEFETRKRDDVQKSYTRTEDAQLIDQTVIGQLSERQMVEKFKSGDLHATIRVFDQTWVLTWLPPGDWKAGVLVSIQRDGPQATFEDLQYCIEYMESAVEPEIAQAA